MKGKYFVILFVLIFIALVVATTVGRSILDDDFGLNQAGAGLNKVHKAAWVWVEANGAVYPDHVALLQGNNYAARLSKPRTRSDLIFGWTLPEEDGRRFVVFDDDSPMRVDTIQWKEMWKQDAKAREELGLRQFDPPD